MWSISVPLLQSEEGCPKGGVVGEKEFLFMINRYFIAYLPPPPVGVLLLRLEEENEDTTANQLPPAKLSFM